MSSAKESYIVVFGRNNFECLQLIVLGWLENLQIICIRSGFPLEVFNLLKKTPFIRNYIREKIKEKKSGIGLYKGLWYEVNEEAITLTLKFYDQTIKDKNKLISYYSDTLKTNKFEAYIKKEISIQIFNLLKELHVIRLLHLNNNKILIVKNPINYFVINYTEHKYKVKYLVEWIVPLWGLFSLLTYYGWLLKEFIHRGLIFSNEKKEYKLSKEVAMGFHRKTLRDSIAIDSSRFEINDILMLQFNDRDDCQCRVLQEAKEKGFRTVSIPKLKINISKNIFNILFFYFWVPFKFYYQLLLNGQSCFFYYLFLFHKECFPVEILMNSYRIKCHISNREWGDVATTIILNKYGAKNIIFNWADLTFFKAYDYAFIAHNIYFTWGDIHYDYHSSNCFVDKKVNIGCIFKEEYNMSLNYKDSLISQIEGFDKKKITVTFFDTSFSNLIHFTEKFFFEYLKIINEFCLKNTDVNVLLKPKSFGNYEEKLLEENRSQFKKIWQEINRNNNFIYLDSVKCGFEEVIAISDVCVSMGLNSPSTVALICGRNALYFDNTGNNYHPFAKKYKNILVFEDENLLFKQIGDILNGGFKCRDIISEGEIRAYDAFPDDRALERLRDNLFELTKDSI